MSGPEPLAAPMGAPELGTTLTEVAAVIGRDLALCLLAAARPGGRRGRRFVFIPKRPYPEHPVAVAVGIEAARALGEAFPSMILELGNGRPVMREWRRGRAVTVLEHGGGVKEAAAAAGVSLKTARAAWEDWQGAGWMQCRPAA